MGHRIKEIRGRLDAVAADMSKFNLREIVGELGKKAKDTGRETASKVRSELIIGREKDKELIIESLLKKQKDDHGDIIPIVAIVGFGGLGKTSLAQLVYVDAKVKSSFDQQIWVCVSEDFNICMIFKEILKSLDNTVKVDNLNLDQVLTELEEKLRGKRYLLVLDDVWNENNLKWDDFSNYLVCYGAPGSKILVTTRSKIVASAMGIRDSYLLEGLNEDQSWALFKQVAFKGQGQIDTDLRVIGEDVARRCKGVPLALKCLGGLMRQKPSKNYWSSVQENGIWKSLEKDDSIGELKHLRYLDLSVNKEMKVLPDAITKLHHLQTLLLYHCITLEELPRDIQHLISLEYLKIDDCHALKYLPKGLGELTSLQRLDRFILSSVEESFSTAATLNELRDLNDLGNSLTIEHLEKVRNVELESKEALKKKKRLHSLQLCWRPLNWRRTSSSERVGNEKDESLLNNLEPHLNLKGLKLSDYGGARTPATLGSSFISRVS
ncbi:NB-ARC - like 10 [Theobroma cacao]|nr:NB-ARC - like 10 [Theobroma cacao]